MAKNHPQALNLDDIGEDGIDELAGGAGGSDLLDAPIDFESVKGFELLPDGEYRFRVQNAEAVLSKSSNKPMGKFRLVVVEGERADSLMFQDLSFSRDDSGRGGMARSKPILIGMGLPETANLSPRAICAALKDAEFWGVVATEQSDGINERTGRPYDPRNRLVSASQTPQLSA